MKNVIDGNKPITIAQMKRKMLAQGKKRKSREGSEEEVIGVYYLIPKKLKRDIEDLKKAKKVNVSAFIREALTLFVENEGDTKTTLQCKA